MPRNTLSRRSMLQLTTGAALAAPLALMPADAAVADVAAPDRTPALTTTAGPFRRLDGVLVISDESPDPSPFRRVSSCKIEVDLDEDGRGSLTICFFGSSDVLTIPLPADVAREFDRVLFHVELAAERRIRERRAAGYVDCPVCRAGRYLCRANLCDEHHLVHPSAISAHLGPWFTAQNVAAELHRVPAAWGAKAVPSPYWVGTDAERLSGTSEDGRVEMVEIQLHGLGWGAGFTPEGDHPDGPTIDLWPTHGTHHHPIDPDSPVEWCAYLPGDPVHGACDTIGEALDRAVASIAGRLATVEPVAIAA